MTPHLCACTRPIEDQSYLCERCTDRLERGGELCVDHTRAVLHADSVGSGTPFVKIQAGICSNHNPCPAADPAGALQQTGLDEPACFRRIIRAFAAQRGD